MSIFREALKRVPLNISMITIYGSGKITFRRDRKERGEVKSKANPRVTITSRRTFIVEGHPDVKTIIAEDQKASPNHPPFAKIIVRRKNETNKPYHIEEPGVYNIASGIVADYDPTK